MFRDGDDNGDRIDVSGLAREHMPPGEIEDRVVSELVARRLLNRRPRPKRYWAMGAAAALAAFVAGYMIGTPRVSSSAAGPNTFALLLYTDSNFVEAPATDPLQHVRTYGAWGADVARSGALVDAGELTDEEWLLDPDPATGGVATVANVTPDGFLTGFFLVRSFDLSSALQMAQTHPHLRNLGTIAVRQIVTP